MQLPFQHLVLQNMLNVLQFWLNLEIISVFQSEIK